MNAAVARVIPLLASPQGGVACVIKKISRSHDADAAGVVFLFLLIRKTTPASLSADASRHFIDCSASPPCGDARRGIHSVPICSHLDRGRYLDIRLQNRNKSPFPKMTGNDLQPLANLHLPFICPRITS